MTEMIAHPLWCQTGYDRLPNPEDCESSPSGYLAPAERGQAHIGRTFHAETESFNYTVSEVQPFETMEGKVVESSKHIRLSVRGTQTYERAEDWLEHADVELLIEMLQRALTASEQNDNHERWRARAMRSISA